MTPNNSDNDISDQRKVQPIRRDYTARVAVDSQILSDCEEVEKTGSGLNSLDISLAVHAHNSF